MKLFLSYPSAERSSAERLALALEAEGHEVFFDRSDLPAGEPYHRRLREAIQAADAMVFLVTPAAVAAGSYTLAELDIARARWRRPAGHVLPVVVVPTPIASLPPYLAAVTLLQPQGDLAAETVAAVARLDGSGGGRGRRLALAALAGLVLLGAVAYATIEFSHRRAADAALRGDETAAAQALQLCLDGSHEPALQQLSDLASHQPPAPKAVTAREDCAMRWQREMHATRSEQGARTFDQQVAIVQPVLLRGLAAATGQRAADLRAHIGWGEYLRRREGSGSADPLPHWQRALADEAGNVYAHAMWGHTLLPARLADAKSHFDAAVASGRDRDFVRRLQFGGALGGNDAATAYAVVVADEMRRGGEALAAPLRSRLWGNAFGYRLLDADSRSALYAALPAADLLATLLWLVPAAELEAQSNVLGRYNLATLQAHAGDRDSARAGFTALERQLRAQGQSGRLLSETQRALSALAAAERSSR